MKRIYWGTAVIIGVLGVGAHAQRLAEVAKGFVTPPDDARPMMRWWWFGPAVVKPELEREILAMKAGGIGGFEIQPVYPMALDDASKGFKNLPYMSPEFLDAVGFAAKTGRANGMRVDMTLASGWPYGGRHVGVDEAAARLRVVAVDVPTGSASVALPSIGNGENLIATFVGDGSAKEYAADGLKRIETEVRGGRVAVKPAKAPEVMVFYIASRTGQQVKRAAVDADGFVLDHFSKAAVENHLKVVGEPLMRAFGDMPPYAVFSDSLEVYAADWTDDLLPEFERRRGYDLTPYLPELVSGTGELAAEVRHDWGVTLTELIDERYLTPIDEWAKAHGTKFRSQTYGSPAVSMSSNSRVALPEGEGPQWNRFSYTRWATSASHLYGRPITSSETWTWLHSPAFHATPLDMKAEADRFFLEGVNQLIGHGWPYTPPGVPEPGWSLYAAAVFDDHNPWWMVMPEVTKYLQRMSYLMRQGTPVNDVAILLPNDDAYATFVPGKVSLSDAMPQWITPSLTQQVLSSGYGFDYVDAESIEKLGLTHKVLVLPHVERLQPATMRAIEAYVERGGKVIAVGTKPDRAPGRMEATKLSSEVKQLSAKLFAQKGVSFVATENALGAALLQATAADMVASSDASDLGFVHRRLTDADVYFVANTSNHAVDTTLHFRDARKFASEWDALDGEEHGSSVSPTAAHFAPYESRVFIFRDIETNEPVKKQIGEMSVVADLSSDWKVRFANGASAETMPVLHSWSEDTATRYYSGTAVYSKTIRVTAEQAKHDLVLDFGEGTPVQVDPAIKSGMRALLESPVREAAIVFVNGEEAGSVWHPPYRVNLTGKVHAGENQVEIRVANTAINRLAGRDPVDYRLLSARYGQRFVPQDMEGLEPLPSGILGPVKLLEMR